MMAGALNWYSVESNKAATAAKCNTTTTIVVCGILGCCTASFRPFDYKEFVGEFEIRCEIKEWWEGRKLKKFN